MKTWVTIAVALLAAHLAASEAYSQMAQRRGSSLWFPTGNFTRLAYAVGLPLLLWAWFDIENNWLASWAALAMCVVAIVTWPTTIVLSAEGVTERAWGGLRRRRVPWENVLYAIRMEIESEREVHLVSEDGRVIKHTKLHVDRQRFIIEVGKYVEVLGGPPRVL